MEASQQNDGKPVEQSIFTKFISYIAGGTTALAYNYTHSYKLSDVHITAFTIHAIKTLQYGIIAHQITNAISDLLLQEQQTTSEATFETHYKYIPEQFAEFDINEESSVQSTSPFISEPEL
ncbi:hypothetical protein [Candidatus Lariskella endosymbiont of Epinotia ramella]|uniref:hypothetical protein n=1 Tax=Candidatus Lariskella endosymbiont of Epinotia ramella TaxID=3066224 RepID=UPI0030CDD856